MEYNVKVWRQKNAKAKGHFETYHVTDVEEDASFLEMLDILNDQLIRKGIEPIAFDHDCREGICGACSLYVDGRAHGPDDQVTTCQLFMRHFKPGATITVEPWRSGAFPVIKDLVVDRTAFDKIMQAGGFITVRAGSAQDGADNLIVKTQGSRHPQTSGLSTTDDDGHVNREDYLYMNGSAIFNFTLEQVPPMMAALLEKGGLAKDEIDYFVFHQANKYMLNTIRKVCGIPKDKFYIDLEHTGNTVSSTILIGLKDCLEQGMVRSGMKVMACGFGVGLSYGGTILHF